MELSVVNKDQIQEEFDVMRGACKNACHIEGLPYLECLPSLRGYAMMQVSWNTFRMAYISEVRESCKFGCSTYVML